jgi:hypothetical protein
MASVSVVAGRIGGEATGGIARRAGTRPTRRRECDLAVDQAGGRIVTGCAAAGSAPDGDSVT